MVQKLMWRLLIEAAREAKPAWIAVENVSIEGRGPVGQRATASIGEDASACVEWYTGLRGLGAGLLVQPRARAAAVSWGAGGMGLAVGAALKPVRWVDWAFWMRDPKGAEDARQILVWLTSKTVTWRFWTRPSVTWRLHNTLRRGRATWVRLLLGGRRSRTLYHYQHKVTVPLSEGEYRATVDVMAIEEWRELAPFRRHVEVSATVLFNQGICLPGENGGERFQHSFSVCSSEPSIAVAEVITLVLEARLRGGPYWTPSRRMRRVASRSDQFGAVIASVFLGELDLGAREVPAARPDEPVAWEIRDPTTGTWSDAGMMRRSEIPQGVIVEETTTAAMRFIALTSLMMTGFTVGTAVLLDDD